MRTNQEIERLPAPAALSCTRFSNCEHAGNIHTTYGDGQEGGSSLSQTTESGHYAMKTRLIAAALLGCASLSSGAQTSTPLEAMAGDASDGSTELYLCWHMAVIYPELLSPTCQDPPSEADTAASTHDANAAAGEYALDQPRLDAANGRAAESLPAQQSPGGPCLGDE